MTSSKNAPKNAAVPKNDFDAAVTKDVSDTNSNRIPDDSRKIVVASSDNSAFPKKNVPKRKLREAAPKDDAATPKEAFESNTEGLDTY